MATDYYVRLNGRGGYKREKVVGVTTYTREAVDNYPGNMYRDTGIAVTDAGTANDSVLTTSALDEDDIYNHVAPKQENKKRFAHIFKDNTSPTPLVIGFYWDDYVAGVTNSNA